MQALSLFRLPRSSVHSTGWTRMSEGMWCLLDVSIQASLYQVSWSSGEHFSHMVAKSIV